MDDDADARVARRLIRPCVSASDGTHGGALAPLALPPTPAAAEGPHARAVALTRRLPVRSSAPLVPPPEPSPTLEQAEPASDIATADVHFDLRDANGTVQRVLTQWPVQPGVSLLAAWRWGG